MQLSTPPRYSSGFALFAALFLALPYLAVAQTEAPDSTSYEGAYRIGTSTGQAAFAMRIDRRDTVLTGPFTWAGGGPDRGLLGSFERSSYEGAYEEGVPTGRWTLRRGTFTPAGGGELDDYYYRVAVSGEEMVAKGSLAAGKPEGTWTHEVTEIVNAEAGPVHFRSEMIFAEGLPQRDFRLENDQEAVLLGRFDREGRAEDAWTVYQDLEESEIWTFADGLLINVSRPNGKLSSDEPVFTPGADEVRLVQLDDAYLRTVAIWQGMNDRSGRFADGPGAVLLRSNANAYARTGAALTDLGAPDFRPGFRVAVPVHPLTAADARRLQSITENTERAAASVQRLLEEANLAVVSRSEPEAARAVAVLRAVQQQLLPPLQTLVADHGVGVLANLPLPEYIRYLWPSGAVAGAVKLDGAQSTVGPEAYSGPGARPFDVVAGGLEEVLALTEYTLGTVQAQREVLQDKINTRERRQVVVALEDRLAYEFRLLDSLIRSQGRRTIKDLRLNQIRDLARSEIDAYAGDDSGLDEDERAGRVISCLEAFEALTVALVDLRDREDAFEASYTDRVWNNFTATLMDETVKRRLIDAYTDVLVPYFRRTATEDLSCETATRLQYEITATHERMTTLRNADTEDLEDDLRGVDDPATVLNLIGVAAPQK